MYEAVRARPAGPSTVARLAATAADYGFTGVVVLNPPDEPARYDATAIGSAYGVDVVDGVELRPADPAQASGAVGHHRPRTTVLSLRGGDDQLDAYAARQGRLDVLAGPIDPDPGLVRAAADHGVRLAVDLGPVLRYRGDRRTAAIARLRKLGELADAYGATTVVTAGPASHLELRAPRELAAVAGVAGFDRAAVERGLHEWGRLAEQNRERAADTYVEPGVRREAEDG